MSSAEVGDDVYGEDPSVSHLEKLASSITGKDAGLFMPSGTQSNLAAILTHCARGDEVIVGKSAHIYQYEGGGSAVLGGIQTNPVPISVDGIISCRDIISAIKPDDFHFARSRLICLENTHNGAVLPLSYPKEVRGICDKNNLLLHLDGARFFNAVVHHDSDPITLAKYYDTISLCLSKGLGAPIGSVLVGPNNFIKEARRWRKVLGGGMRQSGVIAAAGAFALENNIVRLSEDHEKAEEIASLLSERFGRHRIRCQTNMIHLNIEEKEYRALADHFLNHGLVVARPRWVFHKDINAKGLTKIKNALQSFRGPE